MTTIVRRLGTQFSNFSLVGLVGTVAHYAILVLLVEAFGIHAVPASIAGAVLGAAVNYGLNRRYTFKSSSPHLSAAPRFFVTAIAGFLLNGLLMWLAVDKFGAHYLASQAMVTVIVLFWNFASSRIWVFKDGADE